MKNWLLILFFILLMSSCKITKNTKTYKEGTVVRFGEDNYGVVVGKVDQLYIIETPRGWHLHFSVEYLDSLDGY